MAIAGLLFAWLLTAFQPSSVPKQAVVETSAGTFTIDLAVDVAPNHVANFTKLAQDAVCDRRLPSNDRTAWFKAAIRFQDR